MSVFPYLYEFTFPAETFQGTPRLGDQAFSPEFEVLGHTFKLLVHPWGKTSYPGPCAVFLKWCRSGLESESLEGPVAKFSLWVQSEEEGGIRIEKACRHPFTAEEDDWGFVNMVGAETMQMLIASGQPIRFGVTITAIDGIIIISRSLDTQIKLLPAGFSTEAGQSSSSSSSFFSDPTFSDCVVQLTDGTSIPAHRVILSQASSVFTALWTSGTQESQQQQMKMEADPRMATALLRFCYGLPVELEVRQLPELLALADMYNVSSLVKTIVDWITAPGLKLDAAAVAHTAPALLVVLDSLPKQQQRQVQQHIRSAVLGADGISDNEHFLSHWSANDVQSLLKSCTGDAAATVKAAKAAHCWVQHDVEHRQQHWPQLLQSVDCSSVRAADMAALRAEIVYPALTNLLFGLLVEKQKEAEAAPTKKQRG